jgi:hypothetical protein
LLTEEALTTKTKIHLYILLQSFVNSFQTTDSLASNASVCSSSAESFLDEEDEDDGGGFEDGGGIGGATT